MLFNLVLQYPDGTLTPYHNRTSQTVFSGDEALSLSIDWSIHGVYALRADIHKSIPYDESTRYTADDITTKLHYHASREVRLSNATYYYRQHDNSISNAITIRRFDVFVADFALKKHLEKLNCKRHIMQRQERYRWHNLINYWYIFSTNKQLFTPQEQKEIEQSFDFHASTLDHTLLPLSLKLRTLFIPFQAAIKTIALKGKSIPVQHFREPPGGARRQCGPEERSSLSCSLKAQGCVGGTGGRPFSSAAHSR